MGSTQQGQLHPDRAGRRSSGCGRHPLCPLRGIGGISANVSAPGAGAWGRVDMTLGIVSAASLILEPFPESLRAA